MATCPMCAEDVAATEAVCPHCGNVLRAVPTLGNARDTPPPVAAPGAAPAPPAPASQALPSARTWKGYAIPVALTAAVVVALSVKFVVLDGALVESAVTRGHGWHCGGELGVCTRDVRTCETIRRDGERVTGSPSRRCTPQPEAWCFSFRMSDDGTLGAMCHRSREHCDHERQLLATNTMLSTRSYSRCEVVGDLVAAAPDLRVANRADAASLVVPDVVAVVAPPVVVRPPEPPPPQMPVVAAPTIERLVPMTMTASSFISNGRDQFAPFRAFDGDPATTWTEAAHGPGDGQWLQASFAVPRRVRRVSLSTGWDHTSARGEDLFSANSHLRRVRLRLAPGVVEERDVGEDERALVFDSLDVTTDTVRIEAVRVWRGARWADLCLGEVAIEGELSTVAPTVITTPVGTSNRASPP